MAVLKLLLIRHAESLGNRAGCMEGWQSTGLSSQGWQQAHTLGRRLAQENWHPTHVYCSPLRRASQTLVGMAAGWGSQGHFVPETLGTEAGELEAVQAVLAQTLAVPLVWSENLREYQNGIFQGLTWADACQQYPDLCHQLETSLDWVPIPGAESLAAGRRRARRFVENVLDRHANGDRLWIITHHWMLQQVLAILLGCDRTWGFTVPHTALFELWLDRDRWAMPGAHRWNSELWQIKRFNDCQHSNGSL